MKWFPKLYASPSLAGREKKVKMLLQLNRPMPMIWLITLPIGENNQLEIINGKELLQPLYPKDRLKIIGICSNKKEAMEMIGQLVEETYAVTGRADVRSYLLQQWKGWKT